MNNLGDRRLKAEIAAIGIAAGVIGEALGVAAKAERVVGLIKIAGAHNQFGLAIALKTGAGHDVEDAVGAVSKLGAVAAAVDLDVIHILGIELGSEILCDRGVDDGNAIEKPCGLVSAAHVEHVMGDVGSGD